eukprot:EG_transcript_11869
MRTARIVGTAATALGRLHQHPNQLMKEALDAALASCSLSLGDVDGLFAVPSLSHPHFMAGHHFATSCGLLPRTGLTVQTVETCGASPVSALIAAAQFLQSGHGDVAAIVAGDAVGSLPLAEFHRLADEPFQSPTRPLPSPVIPNGYDRVAQWAIASGQVRREQLAMCSVLMSAAAVRHPLGQAKRVLTLPQVLASPAVAPNTTALECAKRTDGGAAVVLASSAFLERRGLKSAPSVAVLGGGEGSGPLSPPDTVDEAMFSCHTAARQAYAEAGLGVGDVDFFGLYDCFPICFIRAIEAVGLAEKGRGGDFVERWHSDHLAGQATQDKYPINTHGGLQAFGAPWAVPAMYNIIEARLLFKDGRT